MESSPLTQASISPSKQLKRAHLLAVIQAHLHARNALSETRKSNPVAASEEHDLAAGEFAHAAQITGGDGGR